MMVIAMTMMTIGFVSCSASDDEMGETVSRVTTDESGFSLLSYSMTAGSAVSEESNSKAENDEKLVCKVLPGGQLMLTHKNVIFDQGTNIKFATQLVGKKKGIKQKREPFRIPAHILCCKISKISRG